MKALIIKVNDQFNLPIFVEALIKLKQAYMDARIADPRMQD